MEDINKIIKKCKEYEEKFGYYIHYVTDDSDDKCLNIHTHGLLRNYGYNEFQILGLPFITEEIGRKIFEKLIDDFGPEGKLCKAIFKDGKVIAIDLKCFDDSIKSTKSPKNIKKCIFKLTYDEFGHIVLRLVFADENGLYPWDDGVDENYKHQWTGEDEKNNDFLINY